jgi:hypothetical protein
MIIVEHSKCKECGKVQHISLFEETDMICIDTEGCKVRVLKGVFQLKLHH